MTRQEIQAAVAEWDDVDVEDEPCPRCGEGDWCNCYRIPVEFPLPYTTSTPV
jgi:hypothetical protein